MIFSGDRLGIPSSELVISLVISPGIRALAAPRKYRFRPLGTVDVSAPAPPRKYRLQTPGGFAMQDARGGPGLQGL